MNRKTVVILSGGMDSTTLLYHCKKYNEHVVALSFDYGQRHKKELKHARWICTMDACVQHEIVDLSDIKKLLKGSALTDIDVGVPEGHYADESMKKTVVPNRNMIMLSIAVGYAISLKFDRVAYAAHAGDHTIYPDCRPEFIARLSTAVKAADWHPIQLYAPFMGMNKAEICKLGELYRVPFEKTWSCYKGGDKHCGVCGTCVERREAFQDAGIPDPTEYEHKGETDGDC